MRSAYTVEFGNLKPGTHEFEFELGKEFFEESEDSLIKDGKINVLLQLERAASHLTLNFKFKGEVKCNCDVCLSELDYPISGEEVLQVKITDTPGEEDADLIYVGRNEHELDLYQHLYDYVHLAMPMKIVCADSLNRSACDERVLEKLNNDKKEDDQPNPQWDKLKDLFK